MIELSIDEVVLRGVPAEQAHQVLASLEARLGELAEAWLDSGGLTTGSRLHDRTESSRRLPSDPAPARSATELGVSVADSVWSEVSGSARRGGRSR